MYPKLIELGPIPVHTYGVLLATALLVSISVAAHLAESDGIPRKRAWDMGFVVILSAIAGAKLLLVLTSLDYYLSDPSRLFSLEFLQAGGVYYGGLLGAIAGCVIYVRLNPDLQPFWKLADAAAPAIALGQSIGRLGCLAAGCDYGSETNVPWAITFTNEYAHEIVGVPLHTPLHPYQAYESISTFLLFVALFFAYKRRQFIGQTFCLYLISYGLIRFILEFYRGDEDRGFVLDGLLSTSQFISLLLIPTAIGAYLILRRRSLKQ
ncbi:MAG TPA: prolipoprotein diacylglyceryl transferase [Acidobacteriota bacterium]|nr:prolipoprotein diacylglyceryl transferase [Acidobacteriota bacterium]